MGWPPGSYWHSVCFNSECEVQQKPLRSPFGRSAMAPNLARNVPGVLRLHAATAADLMMPDPVSIRADASLKEAIALLIDRGFSGAPVIDEAGRPIGVLS